MTQGNKHMRKNNTTLRSEQSGIVSLIVTMLIMFLLSLVVISFARVVRREQRQALDRQLNTQAFYAAETGVNQAINALKTGYTGNTGNGEKTTCDPDVAGPLAGTANELDATVGIKYTCLLIDRAPTALVYDDVGTNQSKVVPIKRADNGVINAITIAWQGKSEDAGGFVSCPAVGGFPDAYPAACKTGVLRIDLVPVAGSISEAALSTTAMTIFLQPRTSGTGPIVYGPATIGSNQGLTVAGSCSAATTPKFCTAQISGLSANEYRLRMKSVYLANAVTICSPDCLSGADLADAQATIDATGKANDVLRRIQVRYPLAITGVGVDNALFSNQTICKRLAITSTSITTDTGVNTDPNNPCSPL